MNIQRIIVGRLATNCYIAAGTDGYVMIDPGGDAPEIVKAATRIECDPLAVISTHGHFDHVLAAREVADNLSIPFFLHKKDVAIMTDTWNLGAVFGISGDPPVPDRLIGKDQTWELGSCTLRAIETPGHTPGSVSLMCGDEMFSGDTLFRGNIGRMDFGGSPDLMKESLSKLRNMPGNIRVHPGHGEDTTLSEEFSNMEYFVDILS